MSVGRWLANERRTLKPRDRTKIARLAKQLGVTERTLVQWRRFAELGQATRIGRPSHGPETHRRALWAVRRELERQDYPGWRPIAQALKGSVPTMLVQKYVSLVKQRRRRRHAAILAKNRVTTRVLKTNAIWSQDGTHLGRVQGKSCEAQVIKDRASLCTVDAKCGSPATGEDVVAQLKRIKRERGTLPLVLATDNGPMYACQEVARFLKKEKVVHLLSLPRTPQHNGAAEIHMRELKNVAALGKGHCHPSHEAAATRLEAAIHRLDQFRLREKLGFKTASRMDEEMPSVHNQDRGRFYELCRKRTERAVLDQQSWRASQLAVREAVFWTMEEFGMVKRERGGRPYAAKRTEDFS